MDIKKIKEKKSFNILKPKIIIVLGSVIVILFLLWTNSFDRIEDILSQKEYYKEKIVYIKGKPLTTFSLPFTGSFYKLEDNTGSIWVLSKIDTIDKNTTVYLNGIVKSSIDIDSVLDQQLTQYNLKIGKIGPVIQEHKRENFLTTLKNMFNR